MIAFSFDLATQGAVTEYCAVTDASSQRRARFWLPFCVAGGACVVRGVWRCAGRRGARDGEGRELELDERMGIEMEFEARLAVEMEVASRRGTA